MKKYKWALVLALSVSIVTLVTYLHFVPIKTAEKMSCRYEDLVKTYRVVSGQRPTFDTESKYQISDSICIGTTCASCAQPNYTGRTIYKLYIL